MYNKIVKSIFIVMAGSIIIGILSQYPVIEKSASAFNSGPCCSTLAVENLFQFIQKNARDGDGAGLLRKRLKACALDQFLRDRTTLDSIFPAAQQTNKFPDIPPGFKNFWKKAVSYRRSNSRQERRGSSRHNR